MEQVTKKRSPRITAAFEYAQIVAGAMLVSLGINMLLRPNEVAPGGFAGLSVILNHVTGLPVGTVLLAFNVPLLALGWRYSGGSMFLRRTLVGMLALTISIDALAPFVPTPTTDRLLVVAYAGVLDGAGLALTFRGRGTQGGVDILARLMRRFLGVRMAVTIFSVNVLVYSLAGLVFGAEQAMLALMVSFVSARVLDTVLQGPGVVRAAMIITKEPEAVRDDLMHGLNRGVTMLSARGGFSGEERPVLYVVVARHEVYRLRQRVLDIDPDAFIAFTAAQEIVGGWAIPKAID